MVSESLVSSVNVEPPRMMKKTKPFMHSQLPTNSIGINVSQFK